jgi:hypothetical protein
MFVGTQATFLVTFVNLCGFILNKRQIPGGELILEPWL